MTEPTKKKRVGPLSSVAGVVGEMAKVYKECRRGELAVEHGSKMVAMLGQIRAGLEGASLEERIARLEARIR